MTRVLFVGAPYSVANHHSRSVTDCFQATGNNSGNLLIGYGLRQQLAYDQVDPWTHGLTPEIVEEQYDRVVIAAANFLYPGFDFTPWSSVLDAVSLPVSMVGLGAQLPNLDSSVKEVPAGTWRLVEIASERSESIGVRGEFTAKVLREHGITNVRVTGCPSLYTSLQPTIKVKSPTDRLEHYVLNGSRNVYKHSSDIESAKRVERQLMQLSVDKGLPYILQNEQPEMQLAAGDDVESHAATMQSLAKFLGRDVDDLVAHWRRHGQVFFDVEQWVSWMRQKHFSVGTRFHGNVAALLAGVPAMVITHDSRTQELCEFAGIPHKSVSSITALDVINLAGEVDMNGFRASYQKNFRNYIEFMNENAIDHRLRSEAPAAGKDSVVASSITANDRADGSRASARPSPVEEFRSSGKCAICRRQVAFEAPDDYFSCRSSLKSSECSYGACVTRERALAAAVFSVIPRRQLRRMAVHEAAPSGRGLTLWLRKRVPGYVGTGYFPKRPWGAYVGTLRNENLEDQTFASETFDLVLHLDVMEHMFNPFAALEECYRTLKPGGLCIFTVPTYADRLKSEQVAFLEADGGTRTIGKPEYHGNPQNPSEGALVTWRYGYDLPVLINRATKFDVEVRRWQAPGRGIMGPMTEVYLLYKNE